ncbi:two-component sensor histidine kinase [Paractinoplanes deccanensis]|uniref:histidine kinase n=1 Tax=Paractinoplanes deccanensis TaxID=113561 RepID=A0ABQ3YEJ5_9ACTN|nr:sensor histidine kinase [Actinoplanes deccanensis]GID78403.1 two-component sensor histidine kinase [Actinoplanes deccanensis]
MQGRTRRIPPWVVDGVLGLAVTATLTAVISARQGGTKEPDALAYLWAAGLGALMLARRQHPRAVLLVSAFGLIAYYAGGYPAVGVGIPLAAALFSAAEAGRPVAAIVTASTVLAVSLVFRLLSGQNPWYVLGYELATHVAAMAMAIALGDSLRSRRAQRAQQRAMTELLARQHERESAGRVREERMAIARDLHDSIGHTVSVIALHAEVAREAAPPGHPALDTALRRIREASSASMRELRTTVRLLRSAEPAGREPVSLGNLAAVLDSARSAGFDVEQRVEVDSGELPRTIDAAAYRIVQEAVTNVVRHARASRVSVLVAADGGRLRVRVTDDGPPPAEPGRGGTGIAGMTERAGALGGSLRTRHEPGGFVVEAELPLGEAA